MKKSVVIASLFVISLAGCEKKIEGVASNISAKSVSPLTASPQYIKYTIPKGDQYCDRSTYVATSYQQLSFKVRFDSSAIYQTVLPSNQNDINKLFGFSDNNAQHHDYSARFGWRWSNNALRLFGYIYNRGVMSSTELGTIDIGAEVSCSIKVNKDAYVFSLNGKETSMPRESTTELAVGYKLYPYFGGDELAPHTITIWIEEL